jgi:hypothetical protein
MSVVYMRVLVQELRDSRKIRLEDLDRLRIEVDGGKPLESGPKEAEGKSPAAAEEIEESWGIAHGELKVFQALN